MSLLIKIRPLYFILPTLGISLICKLSLGQDKTSIYWSTWDIWHSGSGTDPDVGGSTQKLQGLNATGASGSKASLHADDGINTTYDGDLIELGFFKLSDGSASTIAFKGVWTPLTTKTTIGQDSTILTGFESFTSYTIPTGEFDFWTEFYANHTEGDESETVTTYADAVDESPSPTISTNTGSSLSTNLTALDAADGTALLGIRFYDIDTGADSGSITKATNGDTRYNTIMDANWVWQQRTDNANVLMSLHDQNGGLNSSVLFEFNNTAYNSLSDIGTGGANGVGSDNYTATVTYYEGSGVLNLDDDGGGIGDTVLSGLDSTGAQALGEINVGDDNNILTIHSSTGNAYDFNGTIRAAGGGAGQASILKTGAGEQILTGAVNLDGATSGFVDIYEGTLTFNPDSADTQSIEYLTSTDDSDAGTTPILKLDNTSAGTGEILEIGLSNVSSAKTFNGNVELSGANSAHKIKIGTTDYTDEQIITGTITSGNNAMTLVKDGAGRLTLHGDSASTMDANITINDGTLVIGDGTDGGADPGSGTITINKGKLEVAANESIDNTINGGTSDSKKSIVGGDGTIAALTVGSANGEVDVLSPGKGLSSSLTERSGLSNQQVTLGTSSAAEAMGNLTITNLTVNNGAIFDWEISDFNGGANQSSFNDEFDVLRFDQLTVESGSSGFLNIFSVQSNGSAGAVAGIGTHSGNNGILFMDQIANDHGQVDTSLGLSAGSWQMVNWFSVDERAFNYHNGNLMGDWNVWYNGSGDFYLRYTAAPEPSTYIMVTGLLMLPGMRMFRRFMKKAKPEDSSVDA